MLYLLRHGRTEWNKTHKIQGWSDIPLCEEGKEQAREAREKYRDVRFDVCYCSPLIRARETAEIILSGRDIPILYDDRLKEMNFGSSEGRLYASEEPDVPANRAFLDPAHYIAEGGAESFEALFERTGSFLDEIAIPLSKAGKDVLIVGHGAMNLSMICQIREIPLEDFWEFRMENCGLVRVL